MVKNICSYSAIMLLSLMFMAGSVAANPHSKPVLVEGKTFNFFNKFLTAKDTHAYRLTVAEGKETKISINSKEGVSLKIYLPSGEVREYTNEKSFNLQLHAAGEYVIKLESPGISQYTFLSTAK